MAVDGNDISKSSGLSGWNAGATSMATIASGDGHVQFTTGETTTAKIAGLSNGNSSQGYADIDFGIMLGDGGAASVYEKGVLVDSSAVYAAGDVFQVRVTGGVVSYWRNGFRFYTSAAAPTYPLLFDSSLRTPGATLQGAGIWAGEPADCTPDWMTLLGDGPSDRFGTFDLTDDVMAVADSNNGAQGGRGVPAIGRPVAVRAGSPGRDIAHLFRCRDRWPDDRHHHAADRFDPACRRDLPIRR